MTGIRQTLTRFTVKEPGEDGKVRWREQEKIKDVEEMRITVGLMDNLMSCANRFQLDFFFRTHCLIEPMGVN